MSYVTINDIADALGISKSTVSRALNGDDKNVKEETLKKVVETAARMGYRRNEIAVNLRMRSTRTIGVIVPEFTTPFFMAFFSKANSLLNNLGYKMIVMLSDENPEVERRNLEMYRGLNVTGIMICACHSTANSEIYRSLLDSRIPLVFFDRTVDNLDVPMVKTNDYLKSFFLVEHLIRGGRRKILHLSGPKHITNTRERRRGYLDALEKFHLQSDPRYLIETGVGVDDGAAAIEKAIADGLDFDAVFCFTEMQALGAKKQMQECHIRIPEDVAIACMSGTVLSTFVHPALTAVEQPAEKMAEAAVGLIMEKIRNPQTPDKTITLESQLVIRKSTDESSI